ncbi:MAG TPA: PaaI family thioesterase [Terriglobia bacterium]|nr:PaaI family thioesterase [Terriglobia bacterium]
MNGVLRLLEKDRYAKLTGIELVEVAEGRAKARLKISDQHLNGVGIAHGGAIFTLADFVFAAASNSHETIAVAINVSISYLKAVFMGTLVAEAQEVAINPKLASYSVQVRDESGDLVAIFQGMAYRKKDPV